MMRDNYQSTDQSISHIEIIAWDSRKLEAIHLGTADIDAFEEIRSLLDNN